MKLNRSPLMWILLTLTVGLAVFRFTRHARNGEGDTVILGVTIGLVIVGVIWWWQSASRRKALSALASQRPGDLILGLRDVTANTALLKTTAAQLGTTAMGGDESQRAQRQSRRPDPVARREHAGARGPLRPHHGALRWAGRGGVRSHPNLIALVDGAIMVPFSPVLEGGESAQALATRIATIIGLPHESVVAQNP